MKLTGKTLISRNESYEGERIEQKVERIMAQNEPITDGAPMIYTDRRDGVMPEYDPRTDRFDIALDATTAIQKEKVSKRMEIIKTEDEAKKKASEPVNTETKTEQGNPSQ